MVRPIPQVLQKAISELRDSPRGPEQPRFGEEVRALRASLGLTQDEFAERYGLVLANIRNWEQPNKGTLPDSSARLLIDMIKTDPDGVADIVGRARKSRRYGNRKTG